MTNVMARNNPLVERSGVVLKIEPITHSFEIILRREKRMIGVRKMTKVITVNIPPIKRSGAVLSKSGISGISRVERIYEKIMGYPDIPDVIFFLEEDPAIFPRIADRLQEYVFYYPQGFNRCWYAAVVVAVRRTVDCQETGDGTGMVSKSGKWRTLSVNGITMLGVHFPQPSDPTYADFSKKVAKIAEERNVDLIIGDFNPQRGKSVRLPNFRSVLPDRPTSTFGNQLDYIFVRDGQPYSNEMIDDGCMKPGEELFSDHAIIGVDL